MSKPRTNKRHERDVKASEHDSVPLAKAPIPEQAKWRRAPSRAKLEVFLPARNAHPDLHIVAVNEFEPTHQAWAWQVHENGVLVAIGMHESETAAERDCNTVICGGATPAQFQQARDFERVMA